jgi:alpha-glucosidase
VKARAALLVLLALRGTPFLYYGDEIGLPDADLDPAAALDPVPHRKGDPDENRDVCRTPMPWNAEEGAGFTTSGEPWLPIAADVDVASQRDDPSSTLHLVRDLIALRRERADLRGGSYESLPAPAGAWAWRRGERTVVAVNLSGEPVEVELDGTVLVGTDRSRDGERAGGSLRLGPWEGAVVELP